MDINSLTSQFTSVEEMKIFAASQYKQIERLSKENRELKEQVEKAKKESKEVVKRELPSNLSVLDDAKTISQIQLNLLRELSFERELSTDEAKRVEIYNRILVGDLQKKDKPLKADIEILKEADLLKLVE
jgi:hypothetical protein